MHINLGAYPSPPKLYNVAFERLSGGLNLWELDYRIQPDQSPRMKNLWWQDGVLQSRDGQTYLGSGESLDTGYACFSDLFWDNAFFHIGNGLYHGDVKAKPFTLTKLVSDVPERRGTFFRYGDYLYYKNRGGFYRIQYNAPGFTVTQVAHNAYTPVTVINASPETGSGDLYQPANRLTGYRTVWYNAEKDVKEYHIMVNTLDALGPVFVDGVRQTVNVDYTIDFPGKKIIFATAPPVTTPATNNTVQITYYTASTDEINSVMDCEYAMVSGEGQNLCILLGGCPAQPNAVFWNSNDSIGMNDSYWPVSYFNLVGDTEDPVTGFGKQYSSTIVFKAHAVGKAEFTVEKVEGRDSISFTYANINNKTGCDLPWTIQLIENNLVFCNSYGGVHLLRSASAAFENNVECISRNVHGPGESGLLYAVRNSDIVVSYDDGIRYWLCADGRTYLWDYTVSGYSKPSWFYFTNIPGVCFFQDDSHHLYHLDAEGRVTKFARTFSDYGEPIDKVYQFPTQYFGSYERLKDVDHILFALRADTNTEVEIEYATDYERRMDKTSIKSFFWRLVPRDLSTRCLANNEFAQVAKRKPGCRHVRHFSMTLRNNVAGCDLAVVSAQIFYKFQGRER